jgi:hypothetical protein
VYGKIEVSASSWSFVQRGSVKCGVSKCDGEASIIRMPWARAFLLSRLLRRKNDTFSDNLTR